MIILTIKDGILKELVKEKEQDELKKDNWQYRLTTASQEYTIIDYDKDLARPYVKAILAKVNKLKEVKMLWAVIIILIFAYLSFIALFFVQYFGVNDLRKAIATINTTKSPTGPTLQNINRPPENNRYFDNIEEEMTATGKQAPFNNKLLR